MKPALDKHNIRVDVEELVTVAPRKLIVVPYFVSDLKDPNAARHLPRDEKEKDEPFDDLNDEANRFDLVRRAVDERDDEEKGTDGAFDHEPNGNASIDRTVVFEDGTSYDIGQRQNEHDREEEERNESETDFDKKRERENITKIQNWIQKIK